MGRGRRWRPNPPYRLRIVLWHLAICPITTFNHPSNYDISALPQTPQTLKSNPASENNFSWDCGRPETISRKYASLSRLGMAIVRKYDSLWQREKYDTPSQAGALSLLLVNWRGRPGIKAGRTERRKGLLTQENHSFVRKRVAWNLQKSTKTNIQILPLKLILRKLSEKPYEM